MRQKPFDIKFFTGSQVPWTKNVSKKQILKSDEIEEIMDKAVPETTKQPTKFGMKLFNGTYLLSLP